jgi:hypothetical protein
LASAQLTQAIYFQISFGARFLAYTAQALHPFAFSYCQPFRQSILQERQVISKFDCFVNHYFFQIMTQLSPTTASQNLLADARQLLQAHRFY